MKKKAGLWKILLPVAGLVIVVGVVIALLMSGGKHRRPDYDYVAVISHSEMMGMDAGTGYAYYIYPSRPDDGTYFYIKSTSTITIAGADDSRDIDSGDLKSRSDFLKIMGDIERDSRGDVERYVSCYYNENGMRAECESVEELAKKLLRD